MGSRSLVDLKLSTGILWGLAIIASLIFLATTFRAGWTHEETDFPNYYTAAVLARKGAPLHRYYEWPWFQRQMNYAGIEHQLGGYIPQTPLTMLPMIPLARLAVQPAKRVWLLVNLALLAATFWLLSSITRFRAASILLLTFAGWGSLHSNFFLGQYYVVLLFLVTVAFYCLHRGHAVAAGIMLGTVCGLKLYGVPFLLYFAVKRRPKELMGMLAAIFALAALAIAIFGWTDTASYATQILPRSIAGETLDPYNPGNGTLSTLLRRTLVMEPELNPQPLLNLPGVYFFLQAFVTVAILVVSLLGLSKSANSKRDFAWFVVLLLLLSPNTASYTFILLLLPIVIAMDEAAPAEKFFLVLSYILLTARIPQSWIWLFPKLWLLLTVAVVIGRSYWRMVSWRIAAAAVSLTMLFAGLVASERLAAYSREPGRHFERIAVERGAIYSSLPAVLRSGLVYESIAEGRYVLRWLHGNQADRFAFDGEALHPVALSPNGPIQFELVRHRTSTLWLLDPSTGRVTDTALPPADDIPRPVLSPDGRWLAFTVQGITSKQVWLQAASGSPATPLTGGACNSFAPAWEPDSKTIIFASDCDRGLGLPALYRAHNLLLR